MRFHDLGQARGTGWCSVVTNGGEIGVHGGVDVCHGVAISLAERTCVVAVSVVVE